MPKTTFARLADLWLPVGVLAIGVIVSVALWQRVVADRETHLQIVAAERADESARAVEREVGSQLVSLRELASLWEEVGLGPGHDPRSATRLLVESFPSVEAVYHVSADGRRRLIAGSGLPPEGAEAASAARGAVPAPGSGPRLDGPIRDADGRVALRAWVPLDPEDPEASASGWLVGRLSASALLDRALRGVGQGYAIVVRWSDDEIFTLRSPHPDAHPGEDLGWWCARSRIELPAGAVWELAFAPTTALAARRLTPMPAYLLGVGLLLSGALAALAHQLRRTRQQARFLSIGNAALERTTTDLMALNEELEARVAARTAELEEAVSELQAFNHSVSHDLRSPLSAILNLTTILEEDYADRSLDEHGRDLLARIHRSAARGVNLLEGLLQLSRAGRTKLATEMLDMEALVREAFAQARAARPGIDAELRLEPLSPCSGDRALVSDVLTNLLANALKYARPEEKPWIRVRGWRDGDKAVYEVADNGRGFDQRFAGKLFGLFERLHGTEEIDGTGVGLAIVARILRRHGGTIEAEGTIDQGARFVFTLPGPEQAPEPGPEAGPGPVEEA